MVVFSQASEGSTSPPGGWGGTMSSTSSAIRSAGKSSPTTSPNPNPSTMSKPSTQLRFEDVYESFRVASPASPLVQQESGPGHPTIDISGRRCSESFERLAPPMSWRRTFAASLVGMKGWFSTRCALTWKVKATKSARLYFLLQASTRRTAATESGLWLTPTTREEPVDLDKFKARMEKYPNGTTMPNLATQVQQMLPTPRTAGLLGGSGSRQMMTTAVAQGQFTPQEGEAMIGTKLLPTPTASDYTGGCTRTDPERQRDTLAHAMHNKPPGKTSQLSPLFVEEMMGFPKGWTVSPFQSGEESP